jgi:hypothetical protein
MSTRTELPGKPPIYRTILIKNQDLPDIESQLNTLANKGYRVASIIPDGDANCPIVIMELIDDSYTWNLTDQGREAVAPADVLEYPATVDSASDIPF